MANEIEKRNEAFLIYQDENGITRVNVRFEGEQNTERTHKKFLLVHHEGKRSIGSTLNLRFQTGYNNRNNNEDVIQIW